MIQILNSQIQTILCFALSTQKLFVIMIKIFEITNTKVYTFLFFNWNKHFVRNFKLFFLIFYFYFETLKCDLMICFAHLQRKCKTFYEIQKSHFQFYCFVLCTVNVNVSHWFLRNSNTVFFVLVSHFLFICDYNLFDSIFFIQIKWIEDILLF